jgi:hypothetical protein
VPLKKKNIATHPLKGFVIWIEPRPLAATGIQPIGQPAGFLEFVDENDVQIAEAATGHSPRITSQSSLEESQCNKEKEKKKKKKQLLIELDDLHTEIAEQRATIESLKLRLAIEKDEADRLRNWWFVATLGGEHKLGGSNSHICFCILGTREPEQIRLAK